MPSTPPASNAGKKRKRPDDNTKGTKPKPSKAEKAAQAQRIDGVPPSLTPVLLHAIKSRRKYLSKAGASSEQQQQQQPSLQSPSPAPAADPADVLARVAARSEQEHQRRQAVENADSPLERLRLASEDATAAFLNGVKREARSGNRTSGTGSSDGNVNGWSLDQGQGRSHGGGAADSVPVACLSFLLGLLSTDDGSVKLPTRRAALALASELLQRSAECREAYTSPERLRQFIEVVSSMGTSSRDTSTNNHGSSRNGADDEGEGKLRMLVQQEAVQLLVAISDRFGSYYPRLSVAARFLEEREGIVLSSTTNGSGLGDLASNQVMADLRRGRDIAMAKIDKAHERVKKILDRADECFEILVPRFGVSSGRGAPAKEGTQDVHPTTAWLEESIGNGDDDDFGDDDDDIDWEEGDDNDDARKEAIGASPAHVDHEKAVERTLAQMERSRGIEDGGIEISLGDGDGAQGETSAATTTAARVMLGRCVQLLEEKHVPRLAFWSDCLHKADHMMIQQSAQQQTGEMSGTVQSSLVAMPPSARKKRSETLNTILLLKSDCARTISSGAKLGIGSVPNDGTIGSTSQSIEETSAAERVRANPTGVGVVAASSLHVGSNASSWKQVLGVKSKEPKKRKIRIKMPATTPSSRKSAVQIKARKGL